MLPESTKPHQSSTTEGDKQKQLDREVRDMVSALTHGLGELHKPGSSHPEDEEEHGVRIITLAGSNTGATMRSDLDDKSRPHGVEQEALGTFVNSNFQAINNSIMLGGSYTSNDPGVQLDVSEYFEQLGPGKQGKKGKKRDKETSKSDQHSD